MQRLLAFSLILLLCTGCASAPIENTPADRPDGIRIALLDTGISTIAIDSTQVLPGYNYVLNSDDTEDRINHGTAVTSVILGCESAGVEGTAPEAWVVPLVVTDKTEGEVVSVTPEVLAQAVRDSVDRYGAQIINISLGIKKDVPELKQAIEYVQTQGALVVSAVGNEGEYSDLYYPAAYAGVLAVGSHDKHGEISDFSQRSGIADLLAPGEDIWLASRKGKTYGAKGTSYATGFVSAAAAELWQIHPDWDAVQITQALLDTETHIDGMPILDR